MRFLRLDRAGQLTYFLSLCDSSGLLSGFRPGHGAFQVEALWLDVGSMEALELGREVDRFFRRLDIPDARLRTTEVHVPQDSLEAPARRLLEARFGVVRCGVPPRRFLEGAGAGRGAIYS